MQAVEPLPREQEEEYKTVFGFFDREKTGRIQAKDLGACMRCLGEILTEQQLQQMCAGGSIDQNAFLQYFKDKWIKRQSYEELERALRFFDYDSSGRVRGDILRRSLTTIGEAFTEQEADELMRDAGGETFDYAQFAAKLLTST